MNVSFPSSTLNVQLSVSQGVTSVAAQENAIAASRIVLLASYNKLPTLTNCDFVQVLNNVTLRDCKSPLTM